MIRLEPSGFTRLYPDYSEFLLSPELYIIADRGVYSSQLLFQPTALKVEEERVKAFKKGSYYLANISGFSESKC